MIERPRNVQTVKIGIVYLKVDSYTQGIILKKVVRTHHGNVIPRAFTDGLKWVFASPHE